MVSLGRLLRVLRLAPGIMLRWSALLPLRGVLPPMPAVDFSSYVGSGSFQHSSRGETEGIEDGDGGRLLFCVDDDGVVGICDSELVL